MVINIKKESNIKTRNIVKKKLKGEAKIIIFFSREPVNCAGKIKNKITGSIHIT